MFKNRKFAPTCLLLFILGCSAVTSVTAGKRASDASDPLRGLQWMAGYWRGIHQGVLMEECWLAPGAGIMVGMHRDLFGQDKSFFEYLRIEAGPEGIVYMASPRGGSATGFAMKELGDQKVVFENLEHDYPQRILYWLEEGGRLHARIEGQTSIGSEASDWVWERVQLSQGQ